jgi:hypothetical protein
VGVEGEGGREVVEEVEGEGEEWNGYPSTIIH